MKKNLKIAASVALLSSLTFASVSTLQPKQANAAIGAVAGFAPLTIVGISLGGLGLVLLGSGVIEGFNCSGSGCIVPVAMGVGGVAIGALGYLILDDHSVQFGHLSEAQALKAGLTQTEWMSYEDELAEANAVFQDELLERKAELEKTGDVSVENSMASWKRSGAELSSEAFIAIQKLAAQAIKSAQVRR